MGSLARIATQRTLVVVDDDPTGTQTMRDVPVLTRWTPGEFAAVLRDAEPVVFLLTNSRALPVAKAVRLSATIGALIRTTAAATERPVSVVSRSDSTLRGHFPAEVDALVSGLNIPDARVLLAPYFGEGGRVTVADVHYLRKGAEWVPVVETEFARDLTFGYHERDLISWARARTGGDRPVEGLPLELIRDGGPDVVAQRLSELPARAVCVINAACDRDLEVVALASARLEADGLPLVARSAASWVRISAGRPLTALINARELAIKPGPGLIVVGSHVPLTTRQLERLRTAPPIELAWLELDVPLLLDRPQEQSALIARLGAAADELLAQGVTPVIATSRQRVAGMDDLALGARVASALVGTVRNLQRRPAWIVAKGGITASEVATTALGVRHARVIGPLLPGVPVWRCGPESRWPGIPLVVFPGNVGEDLSLVTICGLLSPA